MEAEKQRRLEADICAAVKEALKKEAEKTDQKPEAMTHLNGNTLVKKTDARIAFRGEIDVLESEIILVQQAVCQEFPLLYDHLEEIRSFAHSLIKYEITGEKLSDMRLLGMDSDMIHEKSHHPSRYFGIGHFVPSAADGKIPALLNRLRTSARRTELSACRAFENKDGNFTRPDIIMALNRLSSLFHVMSFMFLAGEYKVPCEKGNCIDVCGSVECGDAYVEIEASGRHIHLNKADADKLFGEGYVFEKVRDLSQPGQYVCRERLSIAGAKGRIDNVVILGPLRSKTQVEISMTDAKLLGITPPVRLSGDISGTPGCTLIRCADGKDAAQVQLQEGVIAAKRHIHLCPKTAARLGLEDNETVSLKTGGERGLVFDNTVVRVSEKFADDAHIDYDEANACGFFKGMTGLIIKKGSMTGAKKTDIPDVNKADARAAGGFKAFTDGGLLTEAKLIKLQLQHGDGFLVEILKNTLVTPLAADFIKVHKIKIERK